MLRSFKARELATSSTLLQSESVQINMVSSLTHVWDSLRRVDLADGLHLRWGCRGLWVGGFQTLLSE